MTRARLLLCLLLLLSVETARGQNDAADVFILGHMQGQNIPGLSIAVVRDGQIVKARGYGLADRRLKTPATADTVYKIASVSKQFIASGVMLLVQDGTVDVNDPISRYLQGTPPHWSDVTIRHLLTHTSGLVREAPGFDPMKEQTDADVVRTAYPLPLRFAPGEKYDYGNVNYFALAEVIRIASDRPWPDFLRDRIFAPLGMHTTWPTNAARAAVAPAAGYSDNNELRPAAEWRALRPSGAFYSTVLDLARWDAALYGDTILTAATREAIWAPVALKDGSLSYYGFGWQLGRGTRKAVYHTGGMPGFNSAFARYPDDRLTVIVLMNLDDVDMDVIFTGLAELYLPDR